MKRGEVWWADHSVTIVPLTTNMQHAGLVGTVVIPSTELGPREDSLAIAFQIRTIPKTDLISRIRVLSDTEMAELDAATDEALGGREGGKITPDSDGSRGPQETGDGRTFPLSA